MRNLRSFIIGNALLGVCWAAVGQVHVLTYHNDNGRTGANLDERMLTPANVNANTFGKLFSYAVDGYVYAQPLYVAGLTIPGKGARNVVFVATQHNSVYAFDADRNSGPTAGLLWRVNLGPSAATPNPDFGTRYGGFDAIVPEVGITGTPVIDLAAGTLYVDAFTHEGATYFHKLHALSLTNGAERPSSPVVIRASVAGTGVGGAAGVVTFEARQHIQRCALTLAGGRIYICYAGYADTDPYHGWIIGLDAASLQLLPDYVFNTTPNSTVAAFGPNAGEGGIWMGGGGLSVDLEGNLFLGVGNGSFNAFNNSGGTEYGSSFLKLSTTRGLAVVDYFTPYNQQILSDNDIDIGSGGVLLLPNQAGPMPHLMVGGGKNGRIYVMNRDRLTTGNNHYNPAGGVDMVIQTLALGGGVYATPAYFNQRVYCAASGDVLAAFSVANGALSSTATSTSLRRFNYPGVTPSVSANGDRNGIVWAIQRSNPALLAAYNATNLAGELYTSAQAAGGRDTLANGVKFVVPTVANGKVYVGGQYALSVFGLLGSPLDIWKTAHFGSPSGNPLVVGNTADPDGDGLINLYEYGLANDPNQAHESRQPAGLVVSNHFQLQFRRNLSATDLRYIVQRAFDLEGSWTNLLTYSLGGGWITNNPGATLSESGAVGAPPDQYVNVTVTELSPVLSGTTPSDPTVGTDPGTNTVYFRVLVRQ